MAWVYPLKENKCVRVMECFQDILRKCGQKPERLNSDRGSELICKKFSSFLKENNICSHQKELRYFMPRKIELIVLFTKPEKLITRENNVLYTGCSIIYFCM